MRRRRPSRTPARRGSLDRARRAEAAGTAPRPWRARPRAGPGARHSARRSSRGGRRSPDRRGDRSLSCNPSRDNRTDRPGARGTAAASLPCPGTAGGGDQFEQRISAHGADAEDSRSEALDRVGVQRHFAHRTQIDPRPLPSERWVSGSRGRKSPRADRRTDRGAAVSRAAGKISRIPPRTANSPGSTTVPVRR